MDKIELPKDKGSEIFSLFGLPLGQIVILFTGIVVLGIYIGVLLFGDNSLTVLLGLQEQREVYEKRIEDLKAKNAALQKEYFELIQLESD